MLPIRRLHDLNESDLSRLFNRFGDDFSGVMVNTVIPIVEEVRGQGDRAVIKYTEKFDRVKLDAVLATEEELENGYRSTPDEVLNAFLEAKDNIEEFHGRQLRENISYERPDGTTLGVMYQPIRSAAVYIPGGKASYPSSVLMGVIPAQIAGTENITLITPPDPQGRVPAVIAAICRILNLNKVLKSGGAQGIAAAAFGTQTVPRSDIIVGPGNVYVTAAKSYLFSLGVIQIDSMAGPSEVLIIADERADPSWVAWDLLSQAEHEENATPLLVTTSEDLAKKVNDEIARDIESGRGRHLIKKAAIENHGEIILVNSIDEAIAFSNAYGPEHMELMVAEPMDYLDRIRNVGSLFMGDYAPVAVGDYYSGTNHILPTGGAARFSSGTSVDTFMRRTTFQNLTKESLRKAREAVGIMSRVEGFDDKHGGSVDIRFREK